LKIDQDWKIENSNLVLEVVALVKAVLVELSRKGAHLPVLEELLVKNQEKIRKEDAQSRQQGEKVK
jgi:hypothetical protein